MMIIEAKRPNESAWDTLLTREAFQEMVDFEDYLYSLKLPYHLDGLNPISEENYVGPEMVGLEDLCKRYNLTTEK